MGLKYYDGDSEKGGKEISRWKYLECSGLNAHFEKMGSPINPTHDFKLLKPFRNNLFEKEKKYFIEERNLDELETNDFELNCFYYSWLNNELKVIKQWLSDTYPNGEKKGILNSDSEQIEILKYKQFVCFEIGKIEKLYNDINPLSFQQTENDSEKLPQEKLKAIFSDFISKEKNMNRQLFAEKLKESFAGIGKKPVAIMIYVLDRDGYIKLPNRGRNQFYNSLQDFFLTDIGTPSNINATIHDIKNKGKYLKNSQHSMDILDCETKINKLLELMSK
jgi:hypothetical protein